MNLRKILSIALTVCLLATQVASVAYAEEIPAETVETVQEASKEAETQLSETVEEKQEEIIFEEPKAEETESDGDIFLEYPLDDVVVTLKADKDAFKDVVGELKLSVVEVFGEEVASQVDEALKNKETENVAKRVTYDITVSDDEKEQQPVKSVKVEFNLKDAPSGADKVNIFHHDEEEGVEKIATKVLKEDVKEETAKVDETKTEEANGEAANTEKVVDKTIEVKEVTDEELAETDDVELINDVTVVGKTDGFSLYTVDFTYEDMTISIAGDSNGNKLDDIVSQLGIDEKVEEATTYQDAECTEEVANGEVKNEKGKTLFSVYESGDSWYVDAVNAFQTEHGLIVKTADGAEYKIKVTDFNGTQTGVQYIDADGTSKTHDATVITNTDTTWGTEGQTTWYVIDGEVDYGTLTANEIQVKGDVHLILKDGCNLMVTAGTDTYAGICVCGDYSLTIYGQANGTGQLTAQGAKYVAGIGGGHMSEGFGSNITINGGKVTATGGMFGAGIGSGKDGSGSNIIINGGKVEANGGDSAAGIGGGGNGNGSNITINGGTVTATGGTGGAGIGGGCNGEGKDITINGGSVTATGGGYAAGIGGGCREGINGGNGSNITISGGKVTAIGGEYGAGIGGGYKGSGSNINISDGEVTATGGQAAAGIGSGYWGSASTITISGGTVTATGGNFGAGIGSGPDYNASGITISGGTVTANGGTNASGIGTGPDANASNITVATTLLIKADGNNPPTTVIQNDGSDLASSLSLNGNRYATVELKTTITLDPNEGTTDKTSVDAIYGKAMPTLLSTELPTRSGYIFNGYFDAATEGTRYYNANGTSANNWDKTESTTKLYAHWTLIPPVPTEYTIAFDSNGGTGTMSSMTTSGHKLTLPANGFTAPTGKKFAGWGVGSKMGDAKAPGTEVVFVADSTVYSMWQDEVGPTPPTPTPQKKTTSDETWSLVPISIGSSSAPISNGTWANTNGAFKYTVNGEPLRNTTAWISYTGSDGKQYAGKFYFDRYGIMQVGWQKIDNIWYYFEPTAGPTQGMMKVTGWVETNGKLYYLGADGKMLANTTTPDGKRVGADGALIQ